MEMERQLAQFQRLFGRNPTHLDSHQHKHRDEPARSILRTIGSRLGAPVRHLTPTVGYRGGFYGQDGYGRPLTGVLCIEGLQRLLEDLPGGWTELLCHPADPCDIDTMYRHQRPAELAVLCDPRVRKLLARLDIQLCSFSDLNRASDHAAPR
jgi:predicted glycoside hydrolase/deacetylase ChbG (UPF0249 family)